MYLEEHLVYTEENYWTHCSLVMYKSIRGGKVIGGSGNGLSPVWRKVIIWINVD